MGNKIRVLVILAVSISLVQIVCYGQKLSDSIADVEQAEQYYNQGKQCKLNGDYQQANEFFKKAQQALGVLTLDENNKTEKIGTTIKLSALTKNEKEVVEFSGVNKPAKKNDELSKDIIADQVALKQAQGFVNVGQLDKAISIYQKLSQTYQNNSDLHYNLALIYLKQSEYTSAIKELELTVALNRRDKDAYYNLGVIYESLIGDSRKALHYYNKYLRYAVSSEEKNQVTSWVDRLKKQTEE